MKQYLDLVKHVIENGTRQPNRTGVDSISLPGAMMRFDLQEGFPAITTRKLAFKSSVGEMIGFLRGYESAADFRDLGCKVWDKNANKNPEWLANPHRKGQDHLGNIYGVQWRGWPAFKKVELNDTACIEMALQNGYRKISEGTEDGQSFVILHREIDQVRECLDLIINDPSSRRILFHAWNWAELDSMALAPCHFVYNLHVNQVTKELSMTMYIRSNDLGLGAPFNISEGSVLLSLLARLTGYTPRWLTYFVGDAHVYVDQLDMLNEQMSTPPMASPRLVISDRVPEFAKTGVYQPEWLTLIEPSDFTLEDYNHHTPVTPTAPMAV